MFTHDVTEGILVSQNNETAAILVFQNNKVAAMLVSQTNPRGRGGGKGGQNLLLMLTLSFVKVMEK